MRALVLIAIVAGLFALIGDIGTVARIATVSIFLNFLFVNMSAIALRYGQPGLDRPYRMPLHIGRMPMIPVMAVLMTLTLMGFTIAALTT